MKDLNSVKKGLFIGIASIAFSGAADLCASMVVDREAQQRMWHRMDAYLDPSTPIIESVHQCDENSRFLRRLNRGMNPSQKELNNAMDAMERLKASMEKAPEGSEYKTKLQYMFNFLDPNNQSQDSFNGARNAHNGSIQDIVNFIPQEEADRFLKRVHLGFDNRKGNEKRVSRINSIQDFANWYYWSQNVDRSLTDWCGRGLFWYAAVSNSWHIASLLLLKGASVESKSPNPGCEYYRNQALTTGRVNSVEDYGTTALHSTVIDGSFEMTAFLLLFGANKDQVFGNDQTAFSETIARGFYLLRKNPQDYYSTMRLLIDMGVQVNQGALFWLFRDIHHPKTSSDIWDAHMIQRAIWGVTPDALVKRGFKEEDVKEIREKPYCNKSFAHTVTLILKKHYGSSMKIDPSKLVNLDFHHRDRNAFVNFIDQIIDRCGIQDRKSVVLKLILVELLLAKGYNRHEILNVMNNRRSVNNKRLEILSLLLKRKMISLKSTIDTDGTTVIQQLKILGFGKKENWNRREPESGSNKKTKTRVTKSNSMQDLRRNEPGW